METHRSPEWISHRAHAQHNVQVVSDTLYQVVEHGIWSLQDIVFPGRVWKSVLDLYKHITEDKHSIMKHILTVTTKMYMYKHMQTPHLAHLLYKG